MKRNLWSVYQTDRLGWGWWIEDQLATLKNADGEAKEVASETVTPYTLPWLNLFDDNFYNPIYVLNSKQIAREIFG